MACLTPLLPAPLSFSPSPCHRVHELSPYARPFRPSPPSRVVLVRWTPPPRSWYKINFDGSVYNDGSRRASIGGVIRDGAGRVVLAFAEQTEHSTVGIVEARAMIRGLQLARELGLDRVVVEGDDLVLVQLLRGEETQTRIPAAMQEEIVGLLIRGLSPSIGGVIRDGAGRVVLAFAEQTEHSTVGIVEARAMIRGLQLARELGLDRVVVEGDDLVLVQLLRGEETQTRIPAAMQEEIVGLLRCFPGRDVRHVYREGNQVAHTLCRQAYHGPGVWVGGRNPLPPAVWEKTEEDRQGVAHERTVLRAG